MKYSLRSLMIVAILAPALIYLLMLWLNLPETFDSKLSPYVDVDGERMTREEFDKRQEKLWREIRESQPDFPND